MNPGLIFHSGWVFAYAGVFLFLKPSIANRVRRVGIDL
jgi:hypothetical protein